MLHLYKKVSLKSGMKDRIFSLLHALSRPVPALYPASFPDVRKYMVFLLFFFCKTAFTQNISTIVTEYDLGAWAYKQHNEICSKIYRAISASNIKVYSGKREAIRMEHALELVQETRVIFMMTDPDDPTIGRDTFTRIPMDKDFYSFSFRGNYIEVIATRLKQSIYLDSNDLYNLLNPENKLYIQKYTQNDVVLLKNIPSKSRLLLGVINIRLFTLSRRPGVELFENDSLNSRFTEDEKAKQGIIEIITFVSKNRDDPTIGVDSVYQKDWDFSDTLYCQALFFVLKTDNFNMEISGMGCGFHTNAYYEGEYALPALTAMGYIKYGYLQQYLAGEKNMLEYCLRFSISDKLSPTWIDYDDYLKKFAIKPKI
jgi:hypothetical protein